MNDAQGKAMGIRIHRASTQALEADRLSFLGQLEALGLVQYVQIIDAEDVGILCIKFQLRTDVANEWAPDWDTLQLCQALDLDSEGNSDDLEREILLAMLLSPVPFQFPSYDELASAVRIRKNIVEAARKTTLAFDTNEAERPSDCWTYSEDRGFTLRPGSHMVTALQKATQPDKPGRCYSFSCYGATEYVILLGIAQEVMTCNPQLFHRLQQQAERRAIKSGEFHEVFLREYGSMSDPLPLKYFVPGDRTWFRNPDDYSSDVAGYEGSWVLYLGGGRFTNFWKRAEPYTLTTKCLELFHWRNATYRDQAGELQIDEAVVEQRVHTSLQDPAEVERILKMMLRLREPSGVYVDGGCIDTSREYPRRVCPGTSDLRLPDH
ncbi:hypothetical protein ACFDAU_11550 [Sulfuriferula sp. GW1]|uniref:hypothetical protein n=1 Tax=Sulfuriferula sp. GW1 TaxID=3345111 RepID=UPI0039AFA55C